MTTTTIALEGHITHGEALRALIVEDQPEIADLLAQILQSLGFCTFIAGNGIEAIRLAKTVKPDLLTLDLNLPVKDGHDVLVELAADLLTSEVPVIVISAYTGNLRPTRQVIGVLQKPFDVQELLDTVALAAAQPVAV